MNSWIENDSGNVQNSYPFPCDLCWGLTPGGETVLGIGRGLFERKSWAETDLEFGFWKKNGDVNIVSY